MKTNRPTFFQFLRKDSASFLLLILVGGSLFAIGLIIYLYGLTFYDEFSRITLLIFVPILLIASFFLVRRYRLISEIFEGGIEVSGIVVEVHVPEGDSQASPQVKFAYEFQGEKYESSNSFLGTKKNVELFSVGQSITILVDSNNPKRAFVKELFVSENQY